MTDILGQDANVTPARKSQVIALSVDSTSRAYDITGLSFDGTTSTGSTDPAEIYLRMFADGTDVFYVFCSDATGSAPTINDATTIAVGGSLAYNVAYCDKIGAGTFVDVLLDRTKDKTLVVKTATGTSGTLRMRASSPRDADVVFP